MPIDLNSAPIDEDEEVLIIPDLNQPANATNGEEDVAEFEEDQIHGVQDQEHNASMINMIAGNILMPRLFSVYSSFNYLSSSSSMHVEHDQIADQDVNVVQDGEHEAANHNKQPHKFDLNMKAGM